MNEMEKRAIICGHTGATGKKVLAELVNAEWISEVVTIGRRSCPEYEGNTKVKQIVVRDMSDLSAIKMEEVGMVDVAFDLIATSVKDAFKGEEFYRKADVEMTSEFARVAKKAGAEFLAAIGMIQSKEGANQYAYRAKTDFENYARTLEFSRLAFMRPMWVDREEATKVFEKLYMMFAKNTTRASDMARCLVWAAQNQTDSEKSYSSDEIDEIGQKVF